MPAPKSSSLALVVVTVPLVAELLVPEDEEVRSTGFVGLRPPYSEMRRST
jgi:hypothetical protein